MNTLKRLNIVILLISFIFLYLFHSTLLHTNLYALIKLNIAIKIVLGSDIALMPNEGTSEIILGYSACG